MESNATDKPVPREITALLSNERLILRETQRAVTPFGGIAVFISFLSKIGFVEAVPSAHRLIKPRRVISMETTFPPGGERLGPTDPLGVAFTVGELIAHLSRLNPA